MGSFSFSFFFFAFFIDSNIFSIFVQDTCAYVDLNKLTNQIEQQQNMIDLNGIRVFVYFLFEILCEPLTGFNFSLFVDMCLSYDISE